MDDHTHTCLSRNQLLHRALSVRVENLTGVCLLNKECWISFTIVAPAVSIGYPAEWKQGLSPPLQLHMPDMFVHLSKKARLLHVPPPLALGAMSAYKTRQQGQTSGLVCEASGSLGWDSFRFFWQVITEALWSNSCYTITTVLCLSRAIALSGWELY